jgi:OFA family oxalate/formate antiporter-like MFS transporter
MVPRAAGLAAGLTAAGFGAGSALTVVPIASMIKASGYEQTFLTFGLLQGVVVVVLGFLLFVPPARLLVQAIAPGAARAQATPFEMARTGVFWMMYLMFVLMAAEG